MSDFCGELHRIMDRAPRFRFPFDEKKIPKNGIYVLFEKGERAHGGDRIVRIGTHTGRDQLRSRLFQHFLRENKDRSIFRKNIGRALLMKAHDPFLAKWELDLTPAKARKEHLTNVYEKKLKATEHKVTRYMQKAFSFAVFRVDDKDERLTLESCMISTVSLCEECKPSQGWLGRSSPKEKIRRGGLWLVNELYKEPLSHASLAKIKTLT
jgi:hypothetical protein